MVEICPEAFVSWQGCGIVSSFLLFKWLSCQPQTLEEDRHVMVLAQAVGPILHFLPTLAAAALYLSNRLPLAFSCSKRQRLCHTSTFRSPTVSSGRWFESKPLGFGFKSALKRWWWALSLGSQPRVTPWEVDSPLDPPAGRTCKPAYLQSFTHWCIE